MTMFDNLIEGQLTANKHPSGAVQLDGPSGEPIALFRSEDIFSSLIGGYQSASEFNDAMRRRREDFAAHRAARATTIEVSTSARIETFIPGPLTPGMLG